MPTYLVTDSLHHDGKAYKPGETVTMDRDQALELKPYNVLGPQLAPQEPGAPFRKQIGQTISTTPLPEDFPGRAELLAADIDTREALDGATIEQLTGIKGIGQATARKILDALAG